MSAALQWTPALSVGIPAVDEQHQELFRRAERLVVALRSGDRGEVVPLLAHLDEYVVKHFAAEEKLMSEAGFPGLEAHAADHRRFREDLAAMARDLRRTGPTALAALTVHNWLSDWLRMHIGGVDQELGRFVQDRPRG